MSSSANALKNTGHRYTQDNNDEEDNTTDAHFEATGNWGTNFPNPSFDTDDNVWGDCTSDDEAEVTSDNGNFPTPDSNYWTSFQWERKCDGSGDIFFTGQLSDYFLFEWQTRHYDLLYTHNYSYSGAMRILETLFAYAQNYIQSAFAHNEEDNLGGVDKELYSYRIDDSIRGREVDINMTQKINSKDDLEKYKILVADELEKLGRENSSKAKVVITFNSPQQPDVFSDFIERNDIIVNAFEMRSVDKSGEKITIGGVPEKDGTIDTLKVFEEMNLSPAVRNIRDIQLKGVTSFEGEINLGNYERINSHPTVYLVDILPETIANEFKKTEEVSEAKIIDVNINDLY